MPEPILIVHGVANHESTPFLANVAELQKSLDQKAPGRWRLIPVVWGDLGGQSVDIGDCLPRLDVGGWTVRAEDTAPLPTPRRPDEAGAMTNAQRAALAAGSATAESGGTETVRADGALAGEIEAALAETRVLQYVDDPEVFAQLGKTLASEAEPSLPGVETFETRGRIGDAVKRAIQGVDAMMGRVLGDRLGSFNQRIREAIARPFSLFFGDIFVYQANKARIQARIWEAIEAHAPGYGTADRPIHVVAHSLGGVVAFDAAIRPATDRPLHMRSFLTFGSQAAFFHIIDPRPGLVPYANGRKVELPETIGRWTNLWDTLDFLAFTAGTVFTLHDGESPVDVPVQDPLSLLVEEKGWAHSIYWKTEELTDALERTLD